MVFLLLGLLVLLASVLAPRLSLQTARFTGLLRGSGLVLLLLGALTAGVRQIEPGEVGVQVLFGRVSNRILESGLNLVNPLVNVVEFDIKTQNYTMSGINDEGTKQGDDAIRVLTADGLEVVIDLTVLYRVIPAKAPDILRQVGKDYQFTIVRPVARTRIRDNAVYYDAVALYSTKRDEFQSRIFRTIEQDFKSRGLFLEQLLVRNITLPSSVRTTIESKINAEQESQKMQFVLQKEKQEADRKRVEAQGIADYQRIINSELSDKLLQYERIKAQRDLAASSNAKIIFMGDGKGSPVILDAK